MTNNLIKVDVKAKGIEELVPVYETSEGNKIVIGRELHEFLEVKSEFRNWVKNRIDDCDLIEDFDYFIDGKNLPANQKREYIIILEAAKEMAMLERNEKGKEYRRYLIAVEKAFKIAVPQLSKELQAIFILDGKQQALESKVNALVDDMPLFSIECDELQALVRKIGVKCLGGKQSPAYKNRSIRGRVYSDIHTEIRRQFNVSKYKAIKRSQLEDAKAIVSEYSLPFALRNEIERINNQIGLGE